MTDSLKTDSTPAKPGAPKDERRPPTSVVTECDLPNSPENVWRALTVPELLAQWLPDVLKSEILAAEPHRLLRYRWPADEHDRDEKGQPLESFVTFELTRTLSGGTHLRIVHRLAAVMRPHGAVPVEGANVIAIKARRRDSVALARAYIQPRSLRWAA